MLIKRVTRWTRCVAARCRWCLSFIEPPQSEVIEAILSHCGLWQSRSPRAPPEVEDLVLELDAAYSGNAIDAPVEAGESHELTYVDIDTFLANF
jgi:hypothetical protein